jgi:hypothetical protein
MGSLPVSQFEDKMQRWKSSGGVHPSCRHQSKCSARFSACTSANARRNSTATTRPATRSLRASCAVWDNLASSEQQDALGMHHLASYLDEWADGFETFSQFCAVYGEHYASYIMSIPWGYVLSPGKRGKRLQCERYAFSPSLATKWCP